MDWYKDFRFSFKQISCLPAQTTYMYLLPRSSLAHQVKFLGASYIFYNVSRINEIVGSFIITYNTNDSKLSCSSINILFRMGMSEDCCLVTLV